MSDFFFGVHRGALPESEIRRRDRIARKHGAYFVSMGCEGGDGPVHYFGADNMGEPFDSRRARAIAEDLERCEKSATPPTTGKRRRRDEMDRLALARYARRMRQIRGLMTDDLTDEPDEHPDGKVEVREGDRIVTVARHGSRCTPYGWPIWVTAVYVAKRRKSDGVLTWRREESIGPTTSGRDISGPMRERAYQYAAQEGLRYVEGVRHGDSFGWYADDEEQ